MYLCEDIFDVRTYVSKMHTQAVTCSCIHNTYIITLTHACPLSSPAFSLSIFLLVSRRLHARTDLTHTPYTTDSLSLSLAHTSHARTLTDLACICGYVCRHVFALHSGMCTMHAMYVVCMYICMYVLGCMCVCVCMYVCMCVCAYMYLVYVCMCACMCIHVLTYK